MATEGQTFEQWLHGARVRPERLGDEQRAVLLNCFNGFGTKAGSG
jgi:hypothetical protein